MITDKWVLRWLSMAEFISSYSRDPSTCVGAVIVRNDNKRIVSLGYNGFPMGVPDLEEEYENREIKYLKVVHAEVNAIIFAYGSVEDCILYCWPFMPCSRCAGIIIQAGISQVFAPKNNNPRWLEEFKIAKSMFKDAKVKLTLI